MKKLFLLLAISMNLAHADPLSPEKAFQFSGRIEKNSVMIYLTTQPDYKLYKDSIKIINDKSKVELQTMIKPAGKIEYNEFLKKYQEEYEGEVLMEIPFKGKGNIDFDIEAQGCTTGLCYSPFKTHIQLKK